MQLSIVIVAYNSNGTLVNGFPMGSNYSGIVLVSSISEGGDYIKSMICRNSSHIDILSFDGDNILSIPSINSQNDLFLIGSILTDGSRYYNLNSESSFILGETYWAQRYNNHSHYPISSGPYDEPEYLENDLIISDFYNTSIDSVNYNSKLNNAYYRGFNSARLLTSLNIQDAKRSTLVETLSNIKGLVNQGYYYSPSPNNNKINSASQLFEFDGKEFIHKGIFIGDSLLTIINQE